MAKFYAVRKGRKTGIFRTWLECQEQIKSYSGAIYKSFTNIDEAEDFLLGNVQSAKAVNKNHKNYAFIDGSYDATSGIYGSGVIIIVDDKKITKKLAGNNPEKAALRNVTGELEAAMFVMNYAQEHNISDIAIYFDYMGIEAWATGDWKANLSYTQNYAQYAREIMKSVNISFVKVAAHTGVELNEAVDGLAKEAVQDFKAGKLKEEPQGTILPKESTPNSISKEDFFFGTAEDRAEIEKLATKKNNEQISFFD